nr:serine protease [Pseudomonas sp. CFBP 13719]
MMSTESIECQMAPKNLISGVRTAARIKAAVIGAAVALLSGCNGIPVAYLSDPVFDQAFIVTSGAPLPMMLMATAIQWNDEYAVTAKHTPFLKDIVHEGRGDLVFFKHKAEHAPQWRDSVPGESVTAVGFNSLYMPVKGQGHAMSAMVRLDAKDGVFYSTHDGATVKGMSGGPVFSEDGKVVGITIAFISKGEVSKLNRPDLASSERVSVYMPYSEINREWRRFENKMAKAQPGPVPAMSSVDSPAALAVARIE